jgi:threonine aldolase
MKQINLISDTITKPNDAMLQYMMQAEVGDDVFGQDPTINALEKKLADMFGKESAIFCPSGTMTNQLAIKCHTNALDELICEKTSHVYQYETGGYSYNSRVAINLIDGENGKLKPQHITAAIRPDYDWLPNSRLVSIENSCNKGGGSYYDLSEMSAISQTCKAHDLRLHLDGARLFNVLVETEDKPIDIGPLFDSISICLSKGLGAPVGSVLIGDAPFIKKARKFRKVMGGGMRQAGYLAAACIYALDNNMQQLKIDNQHAKDIGVELLKLPYVDAVKPVKTNILIFTIAETLAVTDILQKFQQKGIVASQFGAQDIRFVTHNGFEKSDLEDLMQRMKSIKT